MLDRVWEWVEDQHPWALVTFSIFCIFVYVFLFLTLHPELSDKQRKKLAKGKTLD